MYVPRFLRRAQSHAAAVHAVLCRYAVKESQALAKIPDTLVYAMEFLTLPIPAVSQGLCSGDIVCWGARAVGCRAHQDKENRLRYLTPTSLCSTIQPSAAPRTGPAPLLCAGPRRGAGGPAAADPPDSA